MLRFLLVSVDVITNERFVHDGLGLMNASFIEDIWHLTCSALEEYFCKGIIKENE